VHETLEGFCLDEESDEDFWEKIRRKTLQKKTKARSSILQGLGDIIPKMSHNRP